MDFIYLEGKKHIIHIQLNTHIQYMLRETLIFHRVLLCEGCIKVQCYIQTDKTG